MLCSDHHADDGSVPVLHDHLDKTGFQRETDWNKNRIYSGKCGLMYASGSIHDPWFVKNVPIDLEECACIDGAGKIRTYFSIVLPLLKPILTTVVVLDALATWNDIITNQLIVGGNTVAMNIQNALYMQFSAQTADWEHALPGIVMSMIPSLIFFVVMQKHIVGGITAGAVKG